MTKQRKKGRPRAENPMVHTAVVLPRGLLDQLRRDGERSERGLSTEIRRRLQASYRTEELPRDPETAELVEFIRSLADGLAKDLGKTWHQSKYVLAALRGGLGTFLEQYQPEGDAGVYDPGDPSDNPETVGRTHARLIIAARGSGDKKGEQHETPPPPARLRDSERKG